MTAAPSQWVWLGSVLVVLALHLFSVIRTPPPDVDDAWYASRGWALIQTGRPLGTLDAGVFDRYEGGWTYLPYLDAWLRSLAIRAFGLSLFSARVISLLFGILLLLAVYALGRELYGWRTGLVAALLASLTSAFARSAHLARPDIAVSALGFGALALYFSDRGKRWTAKSLLSGLAVGAAFEMHPNGIVYAPVIAGLYLLDERGTLLGSRRFWGFCLGLGAGLGAYAALHILPYPETYRLLTARIYGSWRRPPLLELDVGTWLRSLADTLALPVMASPLRTPLWLAGLILYARRGSAPQRRLLGAFALLIASFSLLVRHKMGYFAVDLAPAADLLAAAFLVKLLVDLSRYVRLGTRAARAGALALALPVLALLLASFALDQRPALGDPSGDYRTVVECIRETVPADKSLMGSQTYWLDMPALTYYSWENLIYYQRCVEGSTLADAFEALRPDYFLVDAHLERFIVEDGEHVSEFAQFLSIPGPQLASFLSSHGQEVAEVETEVYGTVRIYRLEWDRG